jgi:hypothetical protein
MGCHGLSNRIKWPPGQTESTKPLDTLQNQKLAFRLCRSIQHVKFGIKEIDPCRKTPKSLTRHIHLIVHKFGTYHQCNNQSHKPIAKKININGLPKHFAMLAKVHSIQLISHLLT